MRLNIEGARLSEFRQEQEVPGGQSGQELE